MAGLTLDAGALIAADKDDRRFWAFWTEALRRDIELVVPATALAQVWRGPKSARQALVLKACEVEALDEPRAKATGVLCGRAGTSDVVDAHVVAGACARGDDVLTTDPDDLERLAQHVDRPPRIIDIKRLAKP